MGIVANKIVIGNQVIFEKPEEPKLIKEPRSSGSKISANRIIVGSKTVSEAEQAPVDTRLSSYFLVQKESDYYNHNIRNNRR